MNVVLKEVFNVNDPESLDRLSGGFSSPGLYKISVAGKTYVVRFSCENDTIEAKEREIEAQKIVAELGLAPQIIYADPIKGIIIMDFIDTSQKYDPLSEDYLKLLGVSLRKIHEGPVFKDAASIFDVAEFLEGLIQGEKPSTLIQASLLLKELCVDLKDLLDKKPCHNDLNPNNILYSNDEIYFIDWELAGQGDPFFDLVTPMVLYGMTDLQEKTVLDAYLERELLAEETYKLQKMKKVAQIFYGFALFAVSQHQGEALISEEEIESLASPKELLKDGDQIFPKGMQRYALSLLRTALSPI